MCRDAPTRKWKLGNRAFCSAHNFYGDFFFIRSLKSELLYSIKNGGLFFEFLNMSTNPCTPSTKVVVISKINKSTEGRVHSSASIIRLKR